MIQLNRIREAGHIPAAFRDPKRIERHLALIAAFQGNALDLKSAMWKPAKNALKKESGGKCAYCEAPASATAHCDVEHFRPKSVYWWLALCYDNYVFACQICNQVYKKKYFPIAGPQLPPPAIPAGATPAQLQVAAASLALNPLAPAAEEAQWAQACAAEQAELLDPYREDPSQWFAWEADDALREVRLIPSQPGNGRCERIVQAAEQYLGLNREELRQLRYRLYAFLAGFHEIYVDPDAPASIKATVSRTLSDAMQRGSNFAAMVRYFVRDTWGLPIPLPP